MTKVGAEADADADVNADADIMQSPNRMIANDSSPFSGWAVGNLGYSFVFNGIVEQYLYS